MYFLQYGLGMVPSWVHFGLDTLTISMYVKNVYGFQIVTHYHVYCGGESEGAEKKLLL